MQPSIDPDYIVSATWIFFHISCFTFHDIVFAADHCYNHQAIVMTAAAKSKQNLNLSMLENPGKHIIATDV